MSTLNIPLLSTLFISTSLISNNRLSRGKILSLFKPENLPTGNKKLWKKEKLLLRNNFSSFHNIFNISLGVKLHIYLWNLVVRFIFCLGSVNLICRCMDISKYLRVSLGLRDNESSLYFIEDEKPFLYYSYLSSDQALWLTFTGSNYTYLEQIAMIPKTFEPLKFDLPRKCHYLARHRIRG